jgi:hypothetical protein
MKGYLGFKEDLNILYIPGKVFVHVDNSFPDKEVYHVSTDVIFLSQYDNFYNETLKSNNWDIYEFDILDEMVNFISDLRFRNIDEEKISEEAIGIYGWVKGWYNFNKKYEKKNEDNSLDKIVEGLYDLDSENNLSDEYRNNWWKNGGGWISHFE